LIIGFELLTRARRLARGYYSNRLLQREGQDAFGREFDIGLFAGRLNAAASAGSSNRSDCRTFAAAENSTENGASRGSDSNLGGSILAARSGFLLEVIGFNVVPLVTHLDSVELQFEQRSACKLARSLRSDNVSFNVVVRRNGNFAIHRDR